MSTFSTKGGLYERAQKRFNVTNGKRLFTYSFYEKQKLEALVGASLAALVFSSHICTIFCVLLMHILTVLLDMAYGVARIGDEAGCEAKRVLHVSSC